MRIKIAQLLKKAEVDSSVTLAGWVKSKRSSKNFSFLVINDGSSQQDMQVIIDKDAKGYDNLAKILTGASVGITGIVKESQGKNQSIEIHADRLDLYGEAGSDYPLQKKGHTLEFLREIAHLRPRTNTFGAVFRVRNTLSYAIHSFFQSRGFVWAHTPIITSNDCEGAGELFNVTTLDATNPPKTDKGEVDYKKDFFGRRAYLTVSGQLEGEFMASSLGDIYTFGPTFRAENSNTARHLSEFWMVEPECAFADLSQVMSLAEDFVQYTIGKVLSERDAELEFLQKMYNKELKSLLMSIVDKPFARITYTDAVEKLSAHNDSFEYKIAWGKSIQTEHERFLCEKVFKKPVIVSDYPSEAAPFYMRENSDGKTCANMDVLVPGIGELIGGSQREERLDVLERRLKERNIDPSGLEWFCDLRRYGTVPHAGFGLGFERLVMYVTGMTNIRDVIPCPRFPGFAEF